MVDEFVRKKILKSSNSIINQETVYQSYKKFCEINNEKPDSKIWFGRKMNIFGYPSKQISKNERVYFGIAVMD